MLADLQREIRAACAAYRHGVVVRGFNGPDGCTLEEAAELLYDALVHADAYLAANHTAAVPLYEESTGFRARLRGDDL